MTISAVIINGEEKAVQVLPHDDELVTLQWLKEEYYHHALTLQTICKRIKEQGYNIDGYERKGRLKQVPFGIGKGLGKKQ